MSLWLSCFQQLWISCPSQLLSPPHNKHPRFEDFVAAKVLATFTSNVTGAKTGIFLAILTAIMECYHQYSLSFWNTLNNVALIDLRENIVVLESNCCEPMFPSLSYLVTFQSYVCLNVDDAQYLTDCRSSLCNYGSSHAPTQYCTSQWFLSNHAWTPFLAEMWS